MTKTANNNQVRVRFAPSPTGYLHIGGVRTALFNWLYARHHKGVFILRIEDTDTVRSTQESIDMIKEGLKWCGLNWDEGPYLQSDRKEIYTRAVYKLLEEKKAYKCYCTPEELDKKRKEKQAAGMKPLYDGKCRDQSVTSKDAPHVIRFKTPREGKVTVSDLIRGNISFDNTELDDLIIMRSDKTPTYNFVVVVDDAQMKITHVIRGDDHLANTPRQIHIYEGLGFPIPKFVHLPMILGGDKTRLSKRHGAESVLEYRQQGYLPHALINYLARLGWSHKNQEIFSVDELVSYFDFDHVNNSPAVFDPEKLTWLNTHYLKNLDPELFVPFIKNYLAEKDIIKDGKPAQTQDIVKIVPLLKERSKTLVEMAQGMEFYFKEVTSYDEKGVKKFFLPKSLSIIKEMYDLIYKSETFDEEVLKNIFTSLIEKWEVKLVKIAQPVRLALTGKTVSPGIFEVMLLLGKDKVLQKLKLAIEYMDNLHP